VAKADTFHLKGRGSNPTLDEFFCHFYTIFSIFCRDHMQLIKTKCNAEHSREPSEETLLLGKSFGLKRGLNQS
jgi:hypothetical protein